MPVREKKRPRGRPRNIFAEAPQPSQSLDRALRLLKILADHDGLTLSDLAAHAGLPVATAHRLVTTLAAHGLVEPGAAAQTWSIGLEALRIGMAFRRRNNLALLGRPYMQALMERTGETVNLALLDQDAAVFVAQAECPHPLRAFFAMGERRALHASGIGKALLAVMTPQRRQALLALKPLAAFTPKTLTDPAALQADLDEINRRGWALDDEEANIGMRCIAAAIFNEFGEGVAGVSLSGPTARLTLDKVEALAREVMACADAITTAAGGIRPQSPPSLQSPP